MAIFLFIALLLSLAYFVFIGWLIPALKKIKRWESSFSPEVSVVIPFRNEKEHLSTLLTALSQQLYPLTKMEVVLINDHSEDESVAIIEDFQKRFGDLNVQLLHLDQSTGKKAALMKGVQNTRFDLILQTDADCVPARDWVQKAVMPFENSQVLASCGTVKMKGSRTLQKLYCLEFLSLQASGAALIQRGLPVMSNGANLAYRKGSWLKYHPGKEAWASGDDVFFVQKLALENRQQVVLNLPAMVVTTAPERFRDFIFQRVRWGGKTPSYPMKAAQRIAYLVAAENSILVLCFMAGLFISLDFIWIFVALLGFKSAPEYLLTKRYARQTGQVHLLRGFLLIALLYPFYIVGSGILILFGKNFRWKGRPLHP